MRFYLAPWRKYATFRGRAGRAEFWTFTLINWIIIAILLPIWESDPSAKLTLANGMGLGFAVVALLPSIAVTVRRLHDTNRSGAWYFVLFIPFIGGLLLLILAALRGDSGLNQYGTDPRAEMA